MDSLSRIKMGQASGIVLYWFVYTLIIITEYKYNQKKYNSKSTIQKRYQNKSSKDIETSKDSDGQIRQNNSRLLRIPD